MKSFALARTAMLRLVLATALSFGSMVVARPWTNQSGTKIEAELAGVEDGNALLKMGAQLFRVPISSLSQDDQAFIRAWKPTAPAPASTAVKGGSPRDASKKGACLTARNAGWTDQLQALNVGWFYQWKAEKTDDSPSTIEFVPMIFGKPNQITPGVEYVNKVKDAAGFQFLLGFNEPDKEDQSNMTVEAALEAWPQLMNLGLPLISPAAANPEGEWMEKFMAGIKEKGYRVDYIAIHSYGGPGVAGFLDKLERVHRKFDRPLWITEFAVGDWQATNVKENKHSVRDIKDFMKAVLPKLDRLKYVHRYAWFPSSPDDPHLGTSALFNADGSLTELGEVYAKH